MEAITATGVRFGTPAFFVNGHFLSGARPAAEFRARIDALLRGATPARASCELAHSCCTDSAALPFAARAAG